MKSRALRGRDGEIGRKFLDLLLEFLFNLLCHFELDRQVLDCAVKYADG